MDTVLKVLGVLFLLFVGGCSVLMVAGAFVANEAVQEVQKQMIEDAKDDISMAQFNSLVNGTSYADAVQILGRHGEVMSENTFPNGTGGQIHTVMYMWKNSGISSMTAMFQNDALMQKSQLGLK